MDIKNKYINFFVSKGHKQIPSAPVVPENDPSVLFNTAGMQPLIPYLMGQTHPYGTRLCDYQKCLRTNDLNVFLGEFITSTSTSKNCVDLENIVYLKLAVFSKIRSKDHVWPCGSFHLFLCCSENLDWRHRQSLSSSLLSLSALVQNTCIRMDGPGGSRQSFGFHVNTSVQR